jgi:ATP-dependent DNA helicase DinG
VVQAGTGTGKSLGYLVPSIIQGKKTVVATATKALQDQLHNSDLPLLQQTLGHDFTWAVVKGRSNYV